jgi:hypothetical protein
MCAHLLVAVSLRCRGRRLAPLVFSGLRDVGLEYAYKPTHTTTDRS